MGFVQLPHQIFFRSSPGAVIGHDPILPYLRLSVESHQGCPDHQYPDGLVVSVEVLPEPLVAATPAFRPSGVETNQTCPTFWPLVWPGCSSPA
jgi:hypothetical protein